MDDGIQLAKRTAYATLLLAAVTLWEAAPAQASIRTCAFIPTLVNRIHQWKRQQYENLHSRETWVSLQSKIDDAQRDIKWIKDHDPDDRCHLENHPNHDDTKKGNGDGHWTCEDIPRLEREIAALEALQGKIKNGSYVWEQLKKRIDNKQGRIDSIKDDNNECKEPDSRRD
ncbi:MAG: hypothetical protein HY613_07330 [Candidatus Rokubacteria bacterium]|nr:hypothetical protein [Candidatus Rokubacteria bacterium]